MKKFLLITYLLILAITPSAEALEVITETQINQGKAFRDEFKLSFDYPQIKIENKKVEEKINSYIKQQLPTADSLWSSKLKTSYKSPELICFFMGQFHHAEYDGAAHGMPAHLGLTFDLKTGKVLNLNDLFKENSDFEEIINKKVKQRIDTIEYKFKAEFNGIDNDENFYITDEYLILLYPAYLYTSFADSPLRVYIPWKNFDGIMKYKIEKKL